MLGRDGRLAVSDLLGALDARLDHVQIRDAQAIELRSHVAEGRGRVAVPHRPVGAARRDADADPVGAPHGHGGFRDLEQEASAVLDRAAVLIGTLVGPVLQGLIGQIAVRAVDLDAVETRLKRPLGAARNSSTMPTSSSLSARGMENGVSPCFV